MWMIILAVFIVAFTAFYFHVAYKMNFWKRLGVPQAPGTFPFGSNASWSFYLLKKAFNEETVMLYKEYPGEKFLGVYHVFGLPKLTILDLELAKQVLVKDFDYFTDRQPYGHEFCSENSKNNKYWANTLLTLKGDKWKHMRSSLTPVFTGGKLKNMVELIHKASDSLVQHLKAHCNEEIEGKNLMRDFGFDVIASTGFGIEINSFEDPKNPVKQNGDKILGKDSNWLFYLKFIFILAFPSIQKWLDLPLTDTNAMEYFAEVIRSSINERKKDKARRNDFIDLVTDTLTKEQKKIDKEDVMSDTGATSKQKQKHWSDEELEDAVVSNALLLFIAGFDQSSTTSAMIFYFLAKNPTIQDKLYGEISDAIKENGDDKLPYDVVMQLSYLDMVFHETLRCYDTSSHLERATTKDYKIPNTDIVIPKGIHVNVAAPAIMQDRQYFPNPEKFNPNHFSKEAKASRNPYAFSGFGHGPRNCIGMRFAQLQVKIAITRILASFKIETCLKTVDELIPDPTSSSLLPKGSIYVTFKNR